MASISPELVLPVAGSPAHAGIDPPSPTEFKQKSPAVPPHTRG